MNRLGTERTADAGETRGAAEHALTACKEAVEGTLWSGRRRRSTRGLTAGRRRVCAVGQSGLRLVPGGDSRGVARVESPGDEPGDVLLLVY
jgi:hypothetical protein